MESLETRETAESPFNWHPLQPQRATLKPILHDELWLQYKKIQGLHWTPEEVDRTHDRRDWDTRLTPNERQFVKGFLAFFSHADLEVVDLLERIYPHVEGVLEAKLYLDEQRAQENVHTEAYDMQIEGLGLPDGEVAALRHAFRDDPAVKGLFAWVGQWKRPGVPVGELLVADAFTEGVLFQGAFAALQWLRERNLLPGITEYNSFIARDEGVHTITISALVRLLKPRARPSDARARKICDGAVSRAAEFVGQVVPVALIGMNKQLLTEYIRFQADCVLVTMGYDPLYGDANPFPFMDKLCLNRLCKTNFFEKRHLGYRELAGDDTAVVLELRTDEITW